MRNSLIVCIIALACHALGGCSSTATKALSTNDKSLGANATPYPYSWALPKTVIDASVTWKFMECTATPKGVFVKVQPIGAAAVPRGVADEAVGWVSVDAVSIQSWSQNHEFVVETAAGSHLLKSFNSQSKDETATIVGNVINSAVKIATIGLAVPIAAAAPANTRKCGTAQATLNALSKDKAALAALENPVSDAGKALEARIVRLQNDVDSKVNIRVSATFDPGATVLYNGRMGTLSIPEKRMEQAGWFEAENLPPGWAGQYEIDVVLDLSSSRAKQLGCAKECQEVSATKLARNSLFREPAYVPIVFQWKHNPEVPGQAEVVEVVGQSEPLPFGQLGIARTLPLDAPTFGKADWSLAFNDFGEITKATWGSSARGVAASSILLTGSTAAADLAPKIRAYEAYDSSAQALAKETARLTAINTHAEALKKCLALQAAGEVPSCL